MVARVKEWKSEADRLWSAPEFDHRAAALLASDVARYTGETLLRQIASQAAANLRTACLQSAQRQTREAAQRRFAALRDHLYTLDAPRFGRRRPDSMPTPEERHRRLLGLPSGSPLRPAEITQAYKQAAKRTHPDAGGNGEAFRELAAARDALLKRT